MVKLIKKLLQNYWVKLGLVLLALTFTYYFKSFQSYFEGDEWIFFRFYAPAVSSPWWFIRGFTDTFLSQGSLNVHMSPLANWIYVIQYHLFGLKFDLYLINSLLLHTLVGLSLSWLAENLTKSRKTAVISSLLFVTNATHFQAVTWVVASIYTELAVLFGLLSLSLVIKFAQHKNFKFLVAANSCLLFALWSKETAVMFIPLFGLVYLWKVSKKQRYLLKNIGPSLAVIIIFILTQFSNKILNPDLNNAPSSGYEFDLPMLKFRAGSFTLKSFSQTIIPSDQIVEAGVWLTDNQFPYFNQEKETRGSTYLNFTQTVTPELISYLFSILLVVLFISLLSKNKHHRSLRLGWLMYLLGIGPIVAITLKFPWWGYSAIVDSRHLYHLTPGISLLMAGAIISLARLISKKTPLQQNLVLGAVVLMLMGKNYRWLQNTTLELQEASSFTAREMIVSSLMADMKEVPDKLVVFTTSNKSYYGFNYWMLPFQTAFSHMLPVMFSQAYHPHGLPYGAEFYNEDYLKNVPGGLATQGYFESGDHGLGYFLDKKKLFQALDKQSLTAENVMAYDFDADEIRLTNITGDLRNEINVLLEQRRQYQDWKQYGDKEELFIFEADPTWQVTATDYVYEIGENGRRIARVTVYPNQSLEQFSVFVSRQMIAGQKVAANYVATTKSSDFDQDRIVYQPNLTDKVFFTIAGNNLMFYKFEIFDEKQAELLFRSMKFVDAVGEEIGD